MGGGPSSATQGGALSPSFSRPLSRGCRLDIRNARCCLGLKAQLVLAEGVVPGWGLPAETTCIPVNPCCGQKTIYNWPGQCGSHPGPNNQIQFKS